MDKELKDSPEEDDVRMLRIYINIQIKQLQYLII